MCTARRLRHAGSGRLIALFFGRHWERVYNLLLFCYLITRSACVPCSLSITTTMLSRISSNAVRRAAFTAQKLVPLEARRAFVQPSGADRASVVDVPQAYQEDGVFTPRAGSRYSLKILIESLEQTHGRLWKTRAHPCVLQKPLN